MSVKAQSNELMREKVLEHIKNNMSDSLYQFYLHNPEALDILVADLSKEFEKYLNTLHPKFMGIEMKGSTLSFAKELESKHNMKIVYVSSEAIVLEGMFTNSLCSLYVFPNNSDEVGRVCVQYRAEETWYPLESRYQSLKKALTDKYGTPALNNEYFRGYSSTDYFKYKSILDDECVYESMWQTSKDIPGAYVALKFQVNVNKTVSVILVYFDSSAFVERMHANDDL